MNSKLLSIFLLSLLFTSKCLAKGDHDLVILESESDSVETRGLGWQLQSGLPHDPTAFSFDGASNTPYFESRPHISLLLSPAIAMTWNKPEYSLEGVFFYRGEFDFFFHTRTSGPVISRLQNPGILIGQHWKIQDPILRGVGLGLSVAHESNGMFIDNRAQYNAMKATFPADYAMQDFASMGWNSITEEATVEFSFLGFLLRPRISLKQFMNQTDYNFTTLEDTGLFFWEGPRTHIWNYDGLKLDFTCIVPNDFWPLRFLHFPGFPWTHAEFRLGIQGGGLQSFSQKQMVAHPSYYLHLRGRWWHFPWMGFVRLEKSYADPIAYYPLSTYKGSVGIEFSNFSFGIRE